jgi:hypothetical protein
VQVPYLDTETEAYVTREAHMNNPENITAPGSEPYTQFKKMTDLEQIYSLFETIHMPRSLDQSYYVGLDSLEDTAARDLDQVIYRHMRRQHNRLNSVTSDDGSKLSTLPGDLAVMRKPKQAKILMVNQLWLWRLDESMVTVGHI